MQLVLELHRSIDAASPFAFRVGLQSYIQRTDGGGAQSAVLDWDDSLLRDLAAIQQPNCDAAVVQRLGDQLQSFLKNSTWPLHAEAVATAVERGEVVHITLRLSAAELYVVPWEFLTLKACGQRLGALPGVLLRYAWPETHAAADVPSPRLEGGRILLGWSAAGGVVPAHEHQAAIAQACAHGHHPFDPRRDVLMHLTVERLQSRLEEAAQSGESISALHILCHGTAHDSTFGLAWDGSNGPADIVDGNRLGKILMPYAGRVRLVVLCACDSANSGQLGNSLGSVAQALHRAGLAAVVASRFPLSREGSIRLTQTLYGTLLGQPTSLESAIVQVRQKLLALPGLDWATVQLYAASEDSLDTRPIIFRPYRGLLSFGTEHQRFFRGRDHEVKQVQDALNALILSHRPRLVIVSGASGSGKSSMVLSAVVPRLQQQGWKHLLLRPAADGPACLAEALLQRECSGERLLIVVDQFEEIFTALPADARQDFVQRLWALAATLDSGVSVIVTLRVDFLGRCGELRLEKLESESSEAAPRFDRVAYDDAHRIFIAQLGTAELRQSIEEPAAQVGLEIEAGLADRMLADLGTEPGVLPLLEYTLDQLWQRRQGSLLTQSAYRDLGGVIGALARQADALIDRFSKEEKRAARGLLVSLMSIGDGEGPSMRQRRLVPALRPQDDQKKAIFDSVLEHLVRARLLVRSEDQGGSTVEVAHEALIRHWQLLQTWVKEDREKLVALAKLQAWAREWRQDQTALLSGGRLAFAQEAERSWPDDIEDAIRQMIAASMSEAERQTRAQLAAAQNEARSAQAQFAARQRVSRMLGVLIGGLLVSLVITLWQYQHARQSEHTARTAEQQARRAAAEEKLAQQLANRSTQRERGSRAALSAQQTPGDLRTLVTALQAVSPSLQHNEVAPEAAQEGIILAVTAGRYPLLPRLQHKERINDLDFSFDSTQLVTALRDGTAHVWDMETGKELFVLRHPRVDGLSDGVRLTKFSSDGKSIVTVGNNRAMVWSAATGALRFALNEVSGERSFDEPMLWADFSRDNTKLVTVSSLGTRLWDGETGRALADLKKPASTNGISRIGSHMLSPDGHTVAAVSMMSPDADLWDLDGSGAHALLGGFSKQVHCGAFSPDGRLFALGSQDGTARLWSVEGKTKSARPVAQAILNGHSQGVLSLEFSPDSKRVVTASWDGTARLWEVDRRTFTTNEKTVLRGHPYGVNGAHFSPDGGFVLTYGSDETALLWDAADGRPVAEFKGHRSAILFARFAPNGQRIVTVGQDNSILVWDTKHEMELSVLRKPSEQFQSARFLSANTRALTVGPDVVRVWNVEKRKEESSLTYYSIPSYQSEGDFRGKNLEFENIDGRIFGKLRLVRHPLAISPTGKMVMVLADVFHTEIKNIETHKAISLSAYKVHNAKFSKDEKSIMMSTYDGHSISIFNTSTGDATHNMSGWSSVATNVDIAPDNKTALVVLDESNRPADVSYLYLWPLDEHSPRRLEPLKGHTAPIFTAEFSSDSTRILSVSQDGTARIWSVQRRGKESHQLAVLGGRLGAIYAARFSGDGRRVVTSSIGGSAQVWDAERGHEVMFLSGHSNQITSARFSMDGQKVVTAGMDGTARIWSLDSGLPIATFAGHLGPLVDAEFSPDGHRLITTSPYGAAHIYSTELKYYVKRACQLLRPHAEFFTLVENDCRPYLQPAADAT